jgi:hypothetical protein
LRYFPSLPVPGAHVWVPRVAKLGVAVCLVRGWCALASAVVRGLVMASLVVRQSA